MKKEAVRADFLLILTAAIWGFAFVAQRVGMDYVGPFTFNAVRFALGSISLLPLIFFWKARKNGGAPPGSSLSEKGALGYGALAGIVLFAGASLQQMGLVYTTAGKAGFITGLYVILVPIIGYRWGQRTSYGTWFGAVLAVIGLYLLSVTGALTISRGDLLVLASAFFWAGHVLLIGWMSPRMDSLVLASAQYAVCSLLSLLVAFTLETVAVDGILQAAVPILYGGLASVGIAYTLQVVAQRHSPPAHASIILTLEGAFAALGGWMLLGEALSLRALAGCGLMLAGMLVSQLSDHFSPV